MRALAGFLIVGAITAGMWAGGFYSHGTSGPAVAPYSTSQPHVPAHKAGAHHRLHHPRAFRIARLLPAGNGGNSGSAG
jgi:hypothetical protein